MVTSVPAFENSPSTGISSVSRNRNELRWTSVPSERVMEYENSRTGLDDDSPVSRQVAVPPTWDPSEALPEIS